MRTSLLLPTFLLLAACNAEEPTGDDGSGGSTSADAPRILTISTNLKTLHENEQLVVTAVVTDPDGIGDVIGGKLSPPDQDTAYGAFATDASEGAYSASLSWPAIQATESIDTEMGMAIPRTFRATFFDAEGNSTYRDVSVSLQCRDDVDAACDGTCESMSLETHCGTCDHRCPVPSAGFATCDLDGGGICKASTITYNDNTACATQCKAPYGKCYGGVAKYYAQPSTGTEWFTVDVSCGQSAPWQAPHGTETGQLYQVSCECGDF